MMMTDAKWWQYLTWPCELSTHSIQRKKSHVKDNKKSQLAITESGAKHHNHNPESGNKYLQ